MSDKESSTKNYRSCLYKKKYVWGKGSCSKALFASREVRTPDLALTKRAL